MVEHLSEGQSVQVVATKYGLDQLMIVRRLTESLRSSSARYHGVTYTAEFGQPALPLMRWGQGKWGEAVWG